MRTYGRNHIRRLQPLLLLILSCLLFLVCGSPVQAKEKAGAAVRVFDGENRKLLLREGQIYYTNQAVYFQPDADALFAQEQYYYTCSQDGGESFSEWRPLAAGEMVEASAGESAVSGCYSFCILNMGQTPGERPTETSLREEGLTIYRLLQERQAPDISLESDRELSQWQRENLTLSVRLSDGGSGIARVSCTVNQKEIYQKSYERGGEPVPEASVTIEASLEAVAQEGNELTVTVTDRAGNERSERFRYYLDKTAPHIALSGKKADRKKYEPMELAADIHERNYAGTQALMRVERELSGERSAYESAVALTGSDTHLEESFRHDGSYRVTFCAVDSAGNRAEESASFTVDTTPPDIQITGVQDGGSYGAPVEVQVVVTEAFYEGNRVNIQMSRTYGGKTGAWPFGNWANTGKVSSLSKTISENGIYKLAVSATDAAGNRTATDVLTFTVDKSLPVTAIEGIADDGVSGEAVALTMAAWDGNGSSTFLLDGVHESPEGVRESLAMEQLVKTGAYYSAAQTFSEDGRYKILLQAISPDGRGAAACKRFTVDQTPPDISFLKELDGGTYQSFRIPKNISDYIRDMTVFSYQIIINGNEYAPGEEIREEGEYHITVKAEDQAGNRSAATGTFMIAKDAAAGFMAENGEKGEDADGETEMTVQEETVSVTADYAAAEAKKEAEIKEIKDGGGFLAVLIVTGILLIVAGVVALVLRLDTDKPIC